MAIGLRLSDLSAGSAKKCKLMRSRAGEGVAMRDLEKQAEGGEHLGLGSEALLFMASGFHNSQGVDSSSQDTSPCGVSNMAAG